MSNQKIKWVKSLHKNSTRRDEGVFLVEGVKEITHAIDGGYVPISIFICPEIFGEGTVAQLSHIREVVTVSREVYEKITYRGGTEGLLAAFEAKTRSLDELNFGRNPFFLIIESVEKPGNLGAIIRTADGAGVDGVIICDERTDIFNPNVIRASVGTVFTKQVVTASREEVYDFLERHEIAIYGAVISKGSSQHTDADFSHPAALLLGTEHEGLSDFWRKRCQPVIIPMLGVNDSLNVSNAAAVLAYEAVRQRGGAARIVE